MTDMSHGHLGQQRSGIRRVRPPSDRSALEVLIDHDHSISRAIPGRQRDRPKAYCRSRDSTVLRRTWCGVELPHIHDCQENEVTIANLYRRSQQLDWTQIDRLTHAWGTIFSAHSQSSASHTLQRDLPSKSPGNEFAAKAPRRACCCRSARSVPEAGQYSASGLSARGGTAARV